MLTLKDSAYMVTFPLRRDGAPPRIEAWYKPSWSLSWAPLSAWIYRRRPILLLLPSRWPGQR